MGLINHESRAYREFIATLEVMVEQSRKDPTRDAATDVNRFLPRINSGLEMVLGDNWPDEVRT